MRTQPTSRAVKTARRREQLLTVAFDLFREHGYAGTSTKRIAAEAGVTEGLVFHYFPTKEALLFELASRQTTFAGGVLSSLAEYQGQSVRALLHGIARGLEHVTQAEAEFIAFMTAEAHVNPALRALVEAGNALVLKEVVARFSQGVAAGELSDAVSLEAAALGFFGGFSFFFGQHRGLSAPAWRAAAGKFAEAWAELTWRGLSVLSDDSILEQEVARGAQTGLGNRRAASSSGARSAASSRRGRPLGA